MRTKLLFFFITLCNFCFSQESSLYITDSLIKPNKVKIRTCFNGKPVSNYLTEYYNEGGQKLQADLKYKSLEVISTSTRYFYDKTGKLYASLTLVPEGRLKRMILATKYYLCGDSVVTYYQYGKDDKLTREYANDSTNRLFFECVYKYDPLIKTQRWFDKSGNIELEIIKTYEKEKFITEQLSTQYQENKIIRTATEKFINTYDVKGRLIGINHRAEKSTSQIKFKYYKNGLLKSKHNDKYFSNWKYEYQYY